MRCGKNVSSSSKRMTCQHNSFLICIILNFCSSIVIIFHRLSHREGALTFEHILHIFIFSSLLRLELRTGLPDIIALVFPFRPFPPAKMLRVFSSSYSHSLSSVLHLGQECLESQFIYPLLHPKKSVASFFFLFFLLFL